MSTDRRTLLGAGAALALPAWMARAFAGREGREEAAPDFAAAREHARAVGKPLLVIFTDPADPSVQPGVVWGELFAHATEDVWRDLALVEVVCLPREALGKSAEPDRGTRWAALVETDGSDTVRAIAGDLPRVEASARTEEYPAQVRARAAALAGLVRAAILPDAAAPARRSAQSDRSVSDTSMEEHGRHEAALGSDPVVRLVDLDRFAAVVRYQNRPERQADLALAARVRLFEHDPPGARWHTGSDWCPPCGMGRVPPASRYFLHFFTR